MRARLAIFSGRVLLCAENFRNETHRHHTASLIFSRDNPFRVFAGKSAATVHECRGILVAPHQWQSLDSGRASLVVLHLDPHDEHFPAMRKLLDGTGFRILTDDLARRFSLAVQKNSFSSLEDMRRASADIFRVLGEDAPPPARERDERIVKVTDHIRRHGSEPLPASESARLCGLSESRFLHLFRSEMGLPYRNYLKWSRLLHVVAEIAGGANLTDAALRAGFADSAHLSRVFKENFGSAPSEIFRNSRFVQVWFEDI